METRSMARARRAREAAEAAVKASTTINNLPDDCLFHIFGFLPLEDRFRSTAVCKRWRDFGSDSWHNLQKLDLISLEKSKHPLSFAPRNRPRRNRFYRYYRDDDDADDEEDSYEDDENTRVRFTIKYPKLMTLCGGFVKILMLPVPSRFDIIREASETSRNLKRIVIRFENFRDKGRQSKHLGRLFAKNRGTLRSVIIDNMQDFSVYTGCLLELPKKLVELQLWGYKAHYARYAESARTPYFNRFVPALKRLKNLEILVLNGLQISGDQLAMIGNFDNLRYLEIFRSTPSRPVPFEIQAIASRHKLEYLSLQNVKNMTAGWFADLVRNNPDLKHLKLQTCALRPEFIQQLFALSKLETLSLTYLHIAPESLDLTGFPNLQKFVCTTAGDQAVIILLETALNLKLINLSKSEGVTPLVLHKAHVVTSTRTNNVPLHVVVESYVLREWQKPTRPSPLLTVEHSYDFEERTRYGYECNEEELFY
ncbi:uncharacterized protein LOC107035731 [Diachasma alloeum]|uniref:uncharacterized protein LOC107035731 n=1 Tax=Diachasma alloeum TaxID=454923 RepID=UPI0007383D49|nr:uncharacterized protein LOC107035731 [Diachasma alloeum]